jgi:dTDP-glucose 4,6-dehydratase
MGMRVVVTRGAGFLGSHLCEPSIADGCGVVRRDDPSTGAANVAHLLDSDAFQLIRTDVTDHVHVTGPVDAVLDFASPASLVDYLRRPLATLKVDSICTLHGLLGSPVAGLRVAGRGGLVL